MGMEGSWSFSPALSVSRLPAGNHFFHGWAGVIDGPAAETCPELSVLLVPEQAGGDMVDVVVVVVVLSKGQVSAARGIDYCGLVCLAVKIVFCPYLGGSGLWVRTAMMY